LSTDYLYQKRLRDAESAGSAVSARSRPGETPAAPFGDLPRSWADLGSRDPSRAGDRAPPRGVDVKATPAGGLGEAPGGQKTPEISKNAQNGLFCCFWAFLPFLGKIGPFCGFQDPASRGVLHQPLAAGPCNPEKGLFWGSAGKPPKWGFLGVFSPKGLIWGFWPQRGLGSLPGLPRGPGGATGPRREGLM